MGKVHSTQVIGIVSGKGGVGKTTVSANLAVSLASQGKKVMVFDADLGLANAQLALGCRAKYNFSHVLSGKKTLREIIVEGPMGVQLVPGSSGIQHMASLSVSEAAGIIQSFAEIEDDLDYLVVDLAAGLSDSVMTFIGACQHRFVIVKDDPSSLADAYASIKVMIQDYQLNNISIITNCMPSSAAGDRLYQGIMSVIQRFVGGEVGHLGTIREDEMVLRSIKASKPLLKFSPSSAAARDFEKLAKEVAKLTTKTSISGGLQFFLERLARQDLTNK